MRPSQELADALGPVHPAARAMADEMDLVKNAEYITEHMMRIVFPERGDDDAFREQLHRNAYENLAVMWRIIAGRDDLGANPPFGAIAFSDTAAQIGVPLSQFERIYRVGVGLVWSLWYRAAEEYSVIHEVDPWDLLGGPSMIVHAYIDDQISTMLSRYENAQAEHARTREQLQVSVLRQVLDGNAALSEAEIEQALGVRLDGGHVAVAIAAERDPSESGVMADLLRVVPGSHGLLYRQAVQCWLLWVCHPQPLQAAQLAELRGVLEHSRLRCALGQPNEGFAGLAATGRDALEAARLQDMLGDDVVAVVSFDELRLEALIMSDPERAARFVREELRGLAAEDGRTAMLRETARLWLTSGSHVSTANRLGLHEHTVRNRVAQVEALLGGPLIRRRTEILVALRLHRMLERSGAHPPAGD